MFRIASDDPDYNLYIKAGNSLLKEGLASITEEYMFHLTDEGWDYCKTNFEQFGTEQWWPEEEINDLKLKKVING